MRGFTLVEVLVALLLLSIGALALADSLLAARRLQVESGRWMQAAALAEQGIERARAGACGDDVEGSFTRTCSSAAHGRLRRIEVHVRWSRPAARELSLTTLVAE